MVSGETAVLALNLPIVLYLGYALGPMERRVSRRMVLAVLFFLAVAAAEGVFSYVNSNYGVLLHMGVVTCALVAGRYLDEADTRVVHAFILVSLLRIVNAALPLEGIYIYYQFLVIYSILLLSLALYIHRHGMSLAELGIKAPRGRLVGLGILLGVLFGFSEHVVIGQAAIMPRFLWASIFVFFLLGTVEELIFRGALQTALEDVNPLFAILLSSAVFSTMHSIWVRPMEYLYTFYVGVVLALIFHRTRNLDCPIVAHTVINFVLFQVIPFKLA
ncbi:MAG: CPBP family intramembrane metalloprotease [Euryarchaeota archaeon]|nr:CPBP family intramembrane metalloprotease [Euryarchaeota archaeon]